MKKMLTASIATLTLATASMAAPVNGASCYSCHGSDWSKRALGKSKVVAQMTHAEIAEALLGYKDGSYGGSMKGLMKGQIARYTEAELEAFSKTIGR